MARLPGFAPSRPIKLVLTGGPCAGKTQAAAEIARRLGPRALCLPEAATQVYHRLGRTWLDLTLDQRRAAQREMYDLQRSQELAAESTPGADILLLDRGTLDGAGYWPDGPDAFWPAVGTTERAELARYHAVIWLETAAALGQYDFNASNAVRFEDAPGAIASGHTMQRLWSHHPHLTRVPATPTWPEKLTAIEAAVRYALTQLPPAPPILHP